MFDAFQFFHESDNLLFLKVVLGNFDCLVI